MAKILISKKLESKGLPHDVAEEIREIAAGFATPIKSFTLATTPANTAAGLRRAAYEGERLTALYQGERLSVEMVSEATIGAAGVSHQIGREYTLPIGAWLITVSYYAGYYMHVENIVNPALPASN